MKTKDTNNMNLQPTEAQYQLAHVIRQSSTQERAAQLIADSEARAVDGAMRDTPWAANYIDMERELTRLRAELANQKVQNNHNWQFQEISEEALKRAEKAEAECLEQARLLGMSGEREADLLGKLGRLESELAAIKHGHGELGKYEQLRLKNAELQAALAFIAEHGGTKHETECGTISCNGLWCAEQARAAMKGTL